MTPYDILDRMTATQDEVLREVLSRLSRPGLRVALVGGAIRDALIGRPANDLDFVVQGCSSADELAALIGASVRTGFNGVRADIDGVRVDAWRCEDHHIAGGACAELDQVVERLTLDIDRALIILSPLRLVDAGMLDAINARTVELCDPRGPATYAVIARAADLIVRYDFTAGPKLRAFAAGLDHGRRGTRYVAAMLKRRGSTLTPDDVWRVLA